MKRSLINHNLDAFDFIQTTPNLWGKNISLKRVIKKQGLTPDQIIYVGDETRDIAAAKKLEVKVAAVSWGFNSKKTLAAHEPDYLIHNPQELLDLCLKFQ